MKRMVATRDPNAEMNVEVIKAEYTSSLQDLTFNSKPLINVLTMLADENIQHASSIVAAIEEQLSKVETDQKLPILYLIDCIVKNIGQPYRDIFSLNIVKTFRSVFEVVDEKTRAEMFRLRQTWVDIFPEVKLYFLDYTINQIDPAWPVTQATPKTKPKIHFNPKFLKNAAGSPQGENGAGPSEAAMAGAAAATTTDPSTLTMQQELLQKQKELQELQRKKEELEVVLQAQVKLNELKTVPLLAGMAPPRAQILMQRQQAGGGAPVRIAPVNSGLVAAAAAANTGKPTRDPRLLRHLRQQQQQQKTTAPPPGDTAYIPTTAPSPLNSGGGGGVTLGPPRIGAPVLDSSTNKIVSTANKMSVRDSRSEARLVTSLSHNNNNKSIAPSSPHKLDGYSGAGKSKMATSSPPKSPSSKSASRSSRGHRTSRFSSNSNFGESAPKVAPVIPNVVDSPTSKGSGSSKSGESLVKSPTKPMSRHKRREYEKKFGHLFKSEEYKKSPRSSEREGRGREKDKESGSVLSASSSSSSLSSQHSVSLLRSPPSSLASVVAAVPTTTAAQTNTTTAAPPPPTTTAAPPIPTTTTSSSAVFKGLKSRNRRNYLRKTNRSPSFSPEPVSPVSSSGGGGGQDVDLRVAVSQPPPLSSVTSLTTSSVTAAAIQPLPRLQEESVRPPAEQRALTTTSAPSEKPVVVVAPQTVGRDVDLRQQLPPLSAAAAAVSTAKKRPSLEGGDPPVKKSKTEMFDVLFGNEDVDLRTQLPVAPQPQQPQPQPQIDRPLTPPPPPIISGSGGEKDRERDSPKKTAPSSLDAVRAKLASATGRDKIMSKSFRKKRPQEDEDMRISAPHTMSPLSAHENLKKIIISTDDEQSIRAGTMTKEQENKLMSKIIAQIEQAKLKEAQLKDKQQEEEESSSASVIANSSSLQPVSDDELDFNDNDAPPVEPKYGDKDDRISSYPKYGHGMRENNSSNSGGRESRRGGGAYWRGAKRRHWDNMPPHPPARPPIRPWLHPPAVPQMNPINPWRPIGPSNIAFGNVHGVAPQHGAGPDFASGLGVGVGVVPPPVTTTTVIDLEGKPRSPEMPVTDLVVDSVNQDDIKTINIDGIPRDIRYYDETAVVFMNWDDPREISFQDGSRRVMFDDQDVYMLEFNEEYKEISIGGSLHRVKLGGPSREIFIDGKPYECFFGGPAIHIDLAGRMTSVKLDGPPPQVKIGTARRTDLVAGKVNLIIDAKIMVPVFLDAKVQKFAIGGQTHHLRFVHALRTVLINDAPFDVEFGGLPKPITLQNHKHFIRFSVLPRGVRPGFARIKDMEGDAPEVSMDECSQDGYDAAAALPSSSSASANVSVSEPALPVFSSGRSRRRRNRNNRAEDDGERNSNSPQFFQNFMHQNNLDVLSSVMTSSMTPTTGAHSSGGYQVEAFGQESQNSNGGPSSQQQPQQPNRTNKPSNPISQLPTAININDLFQKLVATGIVATSAGAAPTTNSNTNVKKGTATSPVPAAPAKALPRRSPLESMRVVSFGRPETLKVRQGHLYDVLYSGMQCSSCGMRFPPEQSMNYSQHLDWHFRQNRKGKKNIRVAASRRWYYSLSDWKNYEEIEDLEEREKNFFDQQQSLAEGSGGDGEEEVEVPSVPADPDVRHCDVCGDKFDQFFNEDKEEWHLRNAIRVDERTYHPVCYEDYLASLVDEATLLEEEEEAKNEQSDEQQSSNIPGLEINLIDDDDDDDVEMTVSGDEKKDGSSATATTANGSTEEQKSAVDEQKDKSKADDDEAKKTGEGGEESAGANAASAEADAKNEEDTTPPEEDDDVILNEVAPERIEVDDDDDYSAFTGLPTGPTVIKIEQIDDGFMEIEDGPVGFKKDGQITVKTEPIDPDEVQPEKPKEKAPSEEVAVKDYTRTGLISSIDGNVEMLPEPMQPEASHPPRIKINISKPIAVIAPREPAPRETAPPATAACDNNTRDLHLPLKPPVLIDPSQPLPPGEEPPIQLNIKPALQGVKLTKVPRTLRGKELTGMCSIM